ncbi:MAG: hypothetical protein AAGA64_12260 [Bacteroidota bacterium]
MSTTRRTFFKIATVLWIIWGVVHIFAGIITIHFVLSDKTSVAVSGIADKVDPESVVRDYPAAVGAILSQHGFNLFWIGLITFISAFYIWKGNKNAIFLAAICGGLADLGYFLFLDLGGFVNFLPGTLMTFISFAAIMLSFVAHFKAKRVDI